jgi:hypothetical protein
MGANCKRHLFELIAAVWIAAVFDPNALWAQDDDNQRIAREHYANGKNLYDQGDYTNALAEFETAYNAKPHPVVLKSIAECLVQLGDIPGAIAKYEQSIAEAPDHKDKKSQKRIEELKELLGTVQVTSAPSGARIFINGQATDKIAPSDIVLGPGEYDITLSLSGYEPLVKHINLQKAQRVYLEVNFVAEGTAITNVAVEKPAGKPSSQTAQQQETAEESPVPEAKPSAEDSTTYVLKSGRTSGPSTAFWIAAAVTGVGLVSGTVFGTMALGDQSDFEDKPTKNKKDEGERDALIADISFGVAVAGAITGLIVLVLDSGEEESLPSTAASRERFNVTPIAGDKAVGLNAVVTF